MVKINGHTPIKNRKFNEAELLLVAQKLNIEQQAETNLYYLRNAKKINPVFLMVSFWLMKRLGKNSLSSWASHLGMLAKTTISKEALNERLNDRTVSTFESILKNALSQKVNETHLRQSKQNHQQLLQPFNRILIRDSTVQQVNGFLKDHFPGNHSKGEPTALVRIQALYDYTNESWVDFGLKAYTDNDQSAAADIADQLQKDDLLLQDLGYFTLNWLEQVIENQYVITKWDNKTNLYEIDGTKIDLLQLLKKKRRIDRQVLVGKEKKLPMRLVAKKLPKAVADERIAKARKNRHSKSNHSEQYYQLLKYEIYLTNVSAEVLDVNGVAKLYGLRWHIEILFKSWKSFDQFKTVLRHRKMKIERLKFSIYAILIQMVWTRNVIYKYIKSKVKKSKKLSDLKYRSTVNDLLYQIIKITNLGQLDELIPQFVKHATYNKHTKRTNTKDKYNYIDKLHIAKTQT